MWKFPFFFFLAAMSFIGISCSNYSLPEKVHVKAGINPNIPINSASFNFSEKFQNELTKVFSDSMQGQETEDSKIKVFNYTGDPDETVQRFLLSFSMTEQSLDFQKYLSEDINLNQDFEKINQTFTVDAAPKETTISIDMNSQMNEILDKVEFFPLTVPIMSGSTGPQSINLNVDGFKTLSFYSGKLEMKCSIPTNITSGSVTLSGLRVSSINSEQTAYTLTSSNTTQTASFNLADQTLTTPLALVLSYNATGIPVSQITIEIGFSNNTKIKTVSGGTFEPITANLPSDTINSGLPAEFIQAVIGTGNVTITADNLKGINLDLSKIIIKQDPYPENIDYKGTDLKAGLDFTGLNTTQPTSLAGRKVNRNSINVSGPYSLSPAQNSEITFTQNGKLDIVLDLSLKNFSAVYINAKEMIDEFNKENSKIEKGLGDLSNTVKSITLDEVGVKLNIEETQVSGLTVDITSTIFDIKTHPQSIEKGELLEFVNPDSKELVISKDLKVDFTINIESDNTDSILELKNVTAGEEITIFNCTPEIVFEWTAATIDPQSATGENDFTKGKFPQDGGSEISLKGTDLDDILKQIQFENGVKAYLFLSGPSGLNSENGITLKLTAYPDKSSATLYDGKITIVQYEFKLPENGKPFITNIDETIDDKLIYSHPTPINFTDTFNRMLKGDSLSISYEIDFGGSGLTIQKKDIETVSVFKADLVIIIPLRLVPQDGQIAEIDVSEYMEGLLNDDLFSFTKDMGDSADISINTLTLNVGLTGSALKAGDGNNGRGGIIIERAVGDGFTKKVSDGFSDNEIFIPLDNENISIPLADYLGSSQKFTPTGIKLRIGEGGALQVAPNLSLVSISVNAVVDATFDLF